MPRLFLSANTDWYLYNYRLSLAEAARKHGFEVVLVSPPGKYVGELEQRGFRWQGWNLQRQSLNPLVELSSLWHIAMLYRRQHPDLVHHHTAKSVIYGSLAARLAGVRAVVNSITGLGHIYQAESRKAYMLRRVVEPLYRLAFDLPRCAAIFENADDRAYFLNKRLVPEGRTWLVPGVGVDPQRFVPSPEPPGPPVILLAGRLLWDKGVGVLVEAARRLHSRTPARVVLVGEPDLGNPSAVAPAMLAQWQEEGVVEWWGWRSDMPSVYSQCHVVVLPTAYGEGVPTALLEAAACGRPLVASDIPGCRAVVYEGVTGFLVPPNDPQALADALERLALDARLRSRMGNAARQLVLDQFTHEHVNAATLEVYRRILDHDFTRDDQRVEPSR
jgi:glycosyltransferase involved in cell wall biosynthesis